MDRKTDGPAFVPTRDAQLLTSKEVDDDVVIGLACSRNSVQRQEIANEYEKISGTDIVNTLRRGGRFDFSRVMLALFMTPSEHDAQAISNAMKAKTLDTGTLLEIFLTRTNREIQTIKESYNDKYNHELESDLKRKTTGWFRYFLTNLAASSRKQSNSTMDGELAEKDAKALKKVTNKGEKKESVFVDIFCTRSYPQLFLIFDKFQQLFRKDIDDVIEKMFTGSLKEALLATAAITKSPSTYFAHRLDYAFKAPGVDDDTLVRVIVTRREINLKEIKQAFEKAYGNSLENGVENATTNAPYKKFLLQLLA